MDSLVRRLLDLVAAGLGLVLLAPFMVVIGALIKRDSTGPIVFAQERVGRHGRHFSLYKFRSMRATGAEGPLITTSDDSRITPIGSKLRASKLDELPQLFNVVKGDMSLVGPRPEVPEYVMRWPAEQAEVILSVRPGITDPVTLRLRREEELLGGAQDPEAFYIEQLLPAKAAAYVEYVKSRTLHSDLKLLIETVATIAVR